MKEYGVRLKPLDEVNDADCIIAAVAHNEFRELSLDKLSKMFISEKDNQKILIDVKGIYNMKELEKQDFSCWRL